MKSYSLADIAEKLELSLDGDGSTVVTGIASLATAEQGKISFIAHKKYLSELASTKASVMILPEELKEHFDGPKLYSDNAYLCFAKLSALFDDRPVVNDGEENIHPRALIDGSATVAKTAVIGPNVVIGKNVIVGENTQIAANSVVSDNVVIGDDCYLAANVTLYHKVLLGNHVTIHSGTVIGSDGFGNVPNLESKTVSKWQKIYQLGTVKIGDYVEIGANTAVDRGALEDTIIKDGAIIDNHVHIAHNCVIGENTALAASVAMAGSTIIGQNCTFGGCVGIAGHIEIADNSHFSGMSMVTGNIKESGQYSSGTALSPSRQWRKNAVRFNQLDNMFQRLKALEKKQQASSSDAE